MDTPDPLKHQLDRLASELVGAQNLFTQLRPCLDFAGHQKGLALLCDLEARRDAAKLRWENSATPGQRAEIQRLLNHPAILKTERSHEVARLHAGYTLEQASAVIVGLKLSINERAGRVVFPEVAAYGVVSSEVFFVTAA